MSFDLFRQEDELVRHCAALLEGAAGDGAIAGDDFEQLLKAYRKLLRDPRSSFV